MSFRDEFGRFEIVEQNEKKDSFFKQIVKVLVVLILLLSVILLGVYTYKMLTTTNYDEATLKLKEQIILSKQKPRHLSQQEMAIIIQTVIAELQKQQAKNPPHITKESEDSKLLKSLQKVKINEKPKIKHKKKKIKKKIKNIVAKKAKPKVIKKEIVYNAVIIGNKEIKNSSDLARLYASINKISKSKKRKILKSAYTKKIKKEIIIRQQAMRTIVVKEGDTLGSIAHRAYGKASMYKKILKANPDLLNNPHKLRVGMRLRVPK